MGNDCILCLSLYALLVPSYPPPYPSSHQPLSLPTPLQPTLGSHRAFSSRVTYINTYVYTMLLVTVSVCEELLAADAADRSGGIRGPYVWMRHGAHAFYSVEPVTPWVHSLNSRKRPSSEVQPPRFCFRPLIRWTVLTSHDFPSAPQCACCSSEHRHQMSTLRCRQIVVRDKYAGL